MHNITNKGDEERDASMVKEVVGGIIDVSTIVNTVMLDFAN
jgi:hypothetical protein